MIKFYMLSCVIMVLVSLVCVRYDDGSPEYEKKFLVFNLIIFFYLLFGMMIITFQPEIRSFVDKCEIVLFTKPSNIVENKNCKSLYSEGYLKSGASWSDKSGKSHYNSDFVKVEIWKQQIVMSDGSKMTQIYFLEGNYAGVWGYTREKFLSKQ